jgi:hypothetical protein
MKEIKVAEKKGGPIGNRMVMTTDGVDLKDVVGEAFSKHSQGSKVVSECKPSANQERWPVSTRRGISKGSYKPSEVVEDEQFDHNVTADQREFEVRGFQKDRRRGIQ